MGKVREQLQNGAWDSRLAQVYGAKATEQQRVRYLGVLERYEQNYQGEEPRFFSAPGRTEIGGNHTDHNHGCVLAASVNLDAIAAAAPNGTDTAYLFSEGYGSHQVTLTDLQANPAEYGQSISLLRGVLAEFQRRGYKIGGFNAACASDVLSGSGLSSSASYEVLLCTVVNHLFNGGTVDPVEIGQISQKVENVYFGKPSGLMDQTASAVGNCVTIDFADTEKPIIKQVDFDLASYGYALCIVDTGGNHANLTAEYSAIRSEMEAVAGELGAPYLRKADENMMRQRMADLRKKLGDRAILRAMHFYADNRRVAQQVHAIENKEFSRFLELIIESGYSSYMYNQNTYAPGNAAEQPVSLGLALSEELLRGKGAWRVHGGGFAGTIQAFVPQDMLQCYQEGMEAVFGQGSCYILSVRAHGGICVF